MRAGYETVGSSFVGDDLIVMLSRGENSFLCTLTLTKNDESYAGGPWNNYRVCSRLSGGADVCLDKDGNQRECEY
jgi:hypothetical protein